MKRILIICALSLGLVALVSPASFAADTQAPVLVSWKLLDEKADISNGQATVRVEFSITDDSEVTDSVLLVLGSRASTQATGLIRSKLVSKVGKTSTYQASATIGFGKAPGEWSWSLFPLEDVLGNSGGFGPGGTWPNIVMVYDKDFTEAKQIAELKAKNEAEEKLAAEKAAADKLAADLKAKEEEDAKAVEATSSRLKSELNSESSKLSILIDKLLITNPPGSSKKELVYLKSTLNTLTSEFNKGILFEGALVGMYKNDLISLSLKYSKIYSVLNKKTTITCVKGKLTKKVTAIKPVCPAGYKKKT